MTDIKKYSIVAPIGAFGNHLRWLLLLDPTFSFSFIVTDGFGTTLDFTSPEKKIESIKKHVYPMSRTWNNWLRVEWQFRNQLSPYIDFIHEIDIIKSENKYIFLAPDNSESAFKGYVKFNSNLNNVSKDSFIAEINKFKQHSKDLSTNSNVCLLNSDSLLTPELDKNFYQTAIKHFGFLDCYTDANYIHNLWYTLHKKSEIELLEDLTKIYKQ